MFYLTRSLKHDVWLELASCYILTVVVVTMDIKLVYSGHPQAKLSEQLAALTLYTNHTLGMARLDQ